MKNEIKHFSIIITTILLFTLTNCKKEDASGNTLMIKKITINTPFSSQPIYQYHKYDSQNRLIYYESVGNGSGSPVSYTYLPGMVLEISSLMTDTILLDNNGYRIGPIRDAVGHIIEQNGNKFFWDNENMSHWVSNLGDTTFYTYDMQKLSTITNINRGRQFNGLESVNSLTYIQGKNYSSVYTYTYDSQGRILTHEVDGYKYTYEYY